jgi:hypothetical protein
MDRRGALHTVVFHLTAEPAFTCILRVGQELYDGTSDKCMFVELYRLIKHH